MPTKITHLLVLDFEATCVEAPARMVDQEIIEFPCLLYNLETKEVDDFFHSYVRPIANPKLSAFCTKLTGIEQETVDKAPPYPDVLDAFTKWLQNTRLLDNVQEPASGASPEYPFRFLICGDWDLKTMLPAQWKLSRRLQLSAPRANNGEVAVTNLVPADIPPYFLQWINVKFPFGQFKTRRAPPQPTHPNLIPLPRVENSQHSRISHKPRGNFDPRRIQAQNRPAKIGMVGMLNHFGLELEGRHHSGIDDSNNIARIVTKLLENGWDPNSS